MQRRHQRTAKARSSDRGRNSLHRQETDRKWEEGDEISVLEFAATEYGRKGKVVASEEVKTQISSIGINKCACESGFDRKNFVRKLVRGIPVKRNSYNEFVRWLRAYRLGVSEVRIGQKV